MKKVYFDDLVIHDLTLKTIIPVFKKLTVKTPHN